MDTHRRNYARRVTSISTNPACSMDAGVADSCLHGDDKDSRERARRLADGVAGAEIPDLCLTAFTGMHVELRRECELAKVIYVFPGADCSPDGGRRSPHADVLQHQAFDRHGDDLQAYCLSVVGVSGESRESLHARVFEHRVCHELWSDPGLLLARALGLPTFACEGASGFRRSMLVVRGGQVEKVFFPVESPERSATQVLWWLRATGR